MNTPLIIDSTKTTPKVILDPKNNDFIFSGTSMAEDAVNFYMPILEWLKKYSESPLEYTTIVFKMTYFNTASSKLIWEIMIILQNMYLKGHKTHIEWHFQSDDEDMEEAGDIYSERMEIPINLIMDE